VNIYEYLLFNSHKNPNEYGNISQYERFKERIQNRRDRDYEENHSLNQNRFDKGQINAYNMLTDETGIYDNN
jgi:hypothetical protein